MNLKKGKKRKCYTFWRQINEKPSIMPGCPGSYTRTQAHMWTCWPVVLSNTTQGCISACHAYWYNTLACHVPLSPQTGMSSSADMSSCANLFGNVAGPLLCHMLTRRTAKESVMAHQQSASWQSARRPCCHHKADPTHCLRLHPGNSQGRA